MTGVGTAFPVACDRRMWRSITSTLFAGALIASAALPLHAGVITTLFSTGVDNSGNPLALGSIDPHYVVTPGAGPFAVSLSEAWAVNTTSSQWISPAPNTLGGGGPFAYTTTFDLSGFDPLTARITGEWSSDNSATMSLNGNAVGVIPFHSWESLIGFSIASGFQAGVNTLTFAVPNADETANDGPTGLHVRIESATADVVPEPGSLALLGMGLAGIAASRRREQ